MSSTPGRGEDAGFYWLAIGVRMAGELYLCAIIARDIWRPRHDPVRGLGHHGAGQSAQSSSTRSNVVAV